MERFLFIFEMIGTVAFAASGAILGIRKGMDIFGVCILGLTTACGGGMVRDVLLGNTPPAAFQNPMASAVAVVTSLILFLSGVRHGLMGTSGAMTCSCCGWTARALEFSRSWASGWCGAV